MVLRLFIPPGEGQHYISPKRPDPLGANATLQYAIVSSTVLAAGYASFAAQFTQRVTPHAPVSKTALFIRSSARLGVWGALTGAAVNYYYHARFTSVIFAGTVKDPKPAKIWEKTDKYTVEDGCLAGAAAGFVAFLPTLFMRRPSVSWWSRMVGMANIGACAGILGAHSYLQYTGERHKAVEILEKQRQRRNLEFHYIFWDKLLMAKFDPLIQQYVRHNGIWRAYHIPSEAYEAPEKFGISNTAVSGNSVTAETPTASETATDDRRYIAAPDHTQHLKNLNVESVKNELEGCERERQALLKEAEYIAYVLSRRQHEFCNNVWSEEDQQVRIRELQLLSVIFNRVHTSADELARRVFIGNLWLKQKAALESGNSSHSAWISAPNLLELDSHDPTLSIAEMKKLQDQLTGDIQQLEALEKNPAEKERRKKWKQDLDDARTMLRAADSVVFEMEKKVKGDDKAVAKAVKVDEPPDKLEPEKP